MKGHEEFCQGEVRVGTSGKSLGSSVTTEDETGKMTATTARLEPDDEWVDKVGALLAEEERLSWYRDLSPWLRALPPQDEVARIAYAMGFLSLLIRRAPLVVAEERAKLTAVVERLSQETGAALKATAAYHHQLDVRLGKLPSEIATGLSPEALAATLIDDIRDQFSRSGIPAAGRLLREHGDQFGQLQTEQARMLARLQHQMQESAKDAGAALVRVREAAQAARNSIGHWDHEMRQVQWLNCGLILFLGIMMGMLLHWWAFDITDTAPQGSNASIQTRSEQSIVKTKPGHARR